MENPLVVAACQMCATLDKPANLRTAERLVREAARRGATLVALPELFSCLGPLPQMIEQAESLPGPTSDLLSDLARELQITLCAGSIAERSMTRGKGHNTTLLFGPDGSLVSSYRKMHLFDVVIPGGPNITESDFMIAGDRISLTEIAGAKFGHATCYDLRFPELFRAMSAAGVDVFLLPAAFTYVTGRDHWEILLRARAIENQAFVVAPNQFGDHAPGMRSYGHSLIVDPWGEVLARASADREEVIIATLEPSRLNSVRSKVPCLTHRKLS